MATGLDPTKTNSEIGLGLKLRGLREARGLTQEELAVELKTAASSISDWETATAIPRRTQLAKYAEYFGVDREDLLETRSRAVSAREARQVNELRSDSRQAKPSRPSDPPPHVAVPVEPRSGESAAQRRPRSRGTGNRLAIVLALGTLVLLVAAVVVLAVRPFSSSPAQARLWRAPARAGAGVTLVVDSRSAIGAHARLDVGAPLALTTQPVASCAACVIAGTVRHTGQTYRHAVCQVSSDLETNGNLSTPGVYRNPGLASSSTWFGIRQPNGTLGFVNAVWISARQRTTVRLPSCPTPAGWTG